MASRKKLDLKVFTFLLGSQRLRSKALSCYATLCSTCLVTDPRPTHRSLKRCSAYCIQSFLGRISLETLLLSCVNLHTSYLRPSSEEAIFLFIGLRYLYGIFSHSIGVRLFNPVGTIDGSIPSRIL
jgi:hypothetical protein